MKLKRIFAAVTAFALCASLAGCGAAASVSESAAESAAESAVEATPAVTEAPATEETADASEAALRIAGLKGPTTMGLVNLMSDEVASNYNFTMYGAADEIVPLLVKGDLDAAAVPANLAATLYNKMNGAVEVACINTLGVLYIVENAHSRGRAAACQRGAQSKRRYSGENTFQFHKNLILLVAFAALLYYNKCELSVARATDTLFNRLQGAVWTTHPTTIRCAAQAFCAA